MIIKLQIAMALKAALGFWEGGGGGALETAPIQPAGQTVFAYPSGDTGGVVTQTGLAKIHKGEVISGVNNEMGFGNTIVNITDFAGVDIEVDEYRDSDQRIIDVTLRAASGDGTYRRSHNLGN